MKEEKVYTITEYKQGWLKDQDQYHCLYCNQSFTEGFIYPLGEHFLTAEKAIEEHVTTHGGPLAALLELPKETLGVTETQQEILQLFAQKLSDTVIAQRLGISASTVRNHRFKLKEKERQSRIFLSIMESLNVSSGLLPHKGATMLDDRYQITQEEQQKILATYFEDGRVIQFPRKEKRKLVILAKIAQAFDETKNYSEKAVNEILKQFVEDFVTVRRYLIEYGFLDRTKDGQTYWRKK
ncbi:DUF2087 domain-containing protein [Enterococcus olivae]